MSLNTGSRVGQTGGTNGQKPRKLTSDWQRDARSRDGRKKWKGICDGVPDTISEMSGEQEERDGKSRYDDTQRNATLSGVLS